MPGRIPPTLPTLRRLACVAALCCAAAATAAPAPWFVWRSKLNGAEHCAQASPGPGWERVRGPYRDSRCSRPSSPPPSR